MPENTNMENTVVDKPKEKTKKCRLLGISFWMKPFSIIAVSLLFAFFALFFGASSTSPAYGGLCFGPNDFDPTFFLYLGFSFSKGAKPYLEVFDQKGLYIYTFEAIGYSIGGQYGVFLLQVILGWIACSALMLGVRYYTESPFQTYFSGLFYVLFMLCFKFGNHSGELLMPWICLPIMFMLIALKKGGDLRFFLLGTFFAGLQAGFAFGSRPTEAMWGLAFDVFYFIYWLRHSKKWQHLTLNVLISLLGFAIPTLTYSLIAINGGYWNEMFQAIFVQGVAYVGNHNTALRFVDMSATIIGVALLVWGAFYLRKKVDFDLFLFFLVSLLFSGIVNIIIARFPHYWQSSMPLIIIECSFILNSGKIREWASFEKLKKFLTIGLGGVSIVIASIWMGFFYIPQTPIAIMNGGEISSCYAVNAKTRSNLEKIKQSGDKVFLVDGIAATLVYLEQISPEAYFTNQTWWNEDNKEVKQTTLDYLNGENKADWIITNGRDDPSNMDQDIYHAIIASYELDTSIDDYYLAYYHLK